MLLQEPKTYTIAWITSVLISVFKPLGIVYAAAAKAKLATIRGGDIEGNIKPRTSVPTYNAAVSISTLPTTVMNEK